MSDSEITLSLYQDQVAEPVAEPQPMLPTQADTLVLGLGGFGGDTALRTLALCALQGAVPATYTLDNAASKPIAPPLLEGAVTGELVPTGAHCYLDTGARRSALQDYPLLVARYKRLLRGIWVANTESGYDQGGNGGGALPLMTLIDIDLRIGQVRTWLRSALRQGAGREPVLGAGVLGPLLLRQEQARRAPFVLVVAGGAGSCGAGAAQLLGYLIRQEAHKLRLGRPVVWLLLAGPHAFQGLTKRTLINFGATMQALQQSARAGIDRPSIDGEHLQEQAAPYDRVWLVDDPQLPANGTSVQPREVEQFSWRVAAAARALLQPPMRAAYLDHVANGGQAEEINWPGFGTLQIGQGGFVPTLLEQQVAAELAVRRAEALAESLAAA